MKHIFIIPVIFSLLSFPGYSQNLLKLGAGGGFSIVTGPGGFTNSISNLGADFTTEYHLSFKAKLDNPIEPFIPTVSLLYYKLNGSGFISSIGNITTSLNILSFGLGGEFPFGKIPVSPYFGFEVNLNHFGELKNNISSSDTLYSIFSLPSRNRFGVTIGVGGIVKVLPLIDLNVAVSYAFPNLYGRDADEATISIVNIDAIVYFTLF